MRYIMPAVTSSESVDMSRDESVLILLQHCRNMKQQETWLRFITLLLMLGGVSVFTYTCLQDSGTSLNLPEPNAAYSAQQQACPSADPPSASERMHIRLAGKQSNGNSLEWVAELDVHYDEKNHTIVIPAKGYYYVYVTVTITCQADTSQELQTFLLYLNRRPNGYPQDVNLTRASDSIMCREGVFRTVYMGQVFYLNQGDLLKVEASNAALITASAFGAYLT